MKILRFERLIVDRNANKAASWCTSMSRDSLSESACKISFSTLEWMLRMLFRDRHRECARASVRGRVFVYRHLFRRSRVWTYVRRWSTLLTPRPRVNPSAVVTDYGRRQLSKGASRESANGKERTWEIIDFFTIYRNVVKLPMSDILVDIYSLAHKLLAPDFLELHL